MLMAVKREITLAFLSIKYNIMRSYTEFQSFVLSIILSILNNAVFIIQWLVLFGIHGSFGDYRFDDIMFIWAMACSTGAVYGIMFGGAGTLSQLIMVGKLDSFIVQPRNLYFNIATSATNISAFGDLVYSILLCAIFAKKYQTVLVFVILSLTGAFILLAFHMMIGSLTFWISDGRLVSTLLSHVMTAVATYPDKIFNKFIRGLLYSVFPVGFIIFIPAHTLKEPNIEAIFYVLIATLIYLIISISFFYQGKKRYISSNIMSGRL